VGEEELDAAFAERKKRFRSEEAFEQYVTRSGMNQDDMKADLRTNLLRDKVVAALSKEEPVTPESIAAYYEENKERFAEPEQVKVSHILLRLAANASDQEKKAVMAKAKKIRAQAARAGADFAALAREHSQAPDASRGGDLGFISRGRMMNDFDAVAFNLPVNTLSQVVETR